MELTWKLSLSVEKFLGYVYEDIDPDFYCIRFKAVFKAQNKIDFN